MISYFEQFVSFLVSTFIDFIESEPIIYIFCGFVLILIIKCIKDLI